MCDYLLVWLRLPLDRRAVTALEYGLIASVLIAVIMVGFHVLANSVSAKFSSIGSGL